MKTAAVGFNGGCESGADAVVVVRSTIGALSMSKFKLVGIVIVCVILDYMNKQASVLH